MALTQINKAGLDELALDHVFTIGASGSDHYTFQGEGLNGTVNDPTLYLTRGKTYRFENGTGAHPIRIQSADNGTSGTLYNTGVTNNNATGTVIVEVQHDAPDVLYYQCASHANMKGILYIGGALADGTVTQGKLASNSVSNSKLTNSSVDENKLAVNSVVTAKIADSNVTTAKIADEAVTLAKLPHGDGSSNGKFLRANNGADPSFETVSIPAGTTINNNADNRIITGSGTANTLNAESEFTFDGSNLFARAGEGESSSLNLIADQGDDNGDGWKIQSEQDENDLTFKSNISGSYVDKLKLKSNAALECQGDLSAPNVVVTGTGSVQIPDKIVHTGDTNTAIRFPANDNISMESAGSEIFRVTPDAAHGSSHSIQLKSAHVVDGAAVTIGGTKGDSAGIARGMLNIRDSSAYNVTDNGGSVGFSAVFNSGGSHTTMSQIEGVKANNTDGNYEGAIDFYTRHHNGNMIKKARIGQEGLSFENNTAAANCLSDYEEGSYNVTLVGQYGGYANYSFRSGFYTRIGRVVHVVGDIRFNGGWSGSSGNVYLQLPFGTSFASGGTVGNGSIAEWNLGSSTYDYLGITVDNNSANARLTTHDGNNNNTGNLHTGQLGNGRYLKFGFTYITA